MFWFQDSSEDRSEGVEWEEFDVDGRNGVDGKKPQNGAKTSPPSRKDSKEMKNAFK